MAGINISKTVGGKALRLPACLEYLLGIEGFWLICEMAGIVAAKMRKQKEEKENGKTNGRVRGTH